MKIAFGFLFSLIIPAGTLFSQDIPVPEGRSLRQISAEKFPNHEVLIGATTGSWAFGNPTGRILDREFSYVTPENDFKQLRIKPDNDSPLNWAQSDPWVEHIRENGQILRVHGPVGPQCSRWATADERTPEELKKNMLDYFTALCQRYNGTGGFEYIDVVNETVLNGKWHREKPGNDWQNPWYIIGQDDDPNKTPSYIRMAFEIANKYAPDMKLIFNHHDHPDKVSDWELIKETINYLRGLGLRVDGIGWQAHVDLGWATEENLKLLEELIDWAHANGLEFHITEASVWITKEPDEQDYEQQGKEYAAILEVVLSKRSTGKVGWNAWQIDDGTAWNRHWYPAFFDRDFNPKPSYYAIQELLESQ